MSNFKGVRLSSSSDFSYYYSSVHFFSIDIFLFGFNVAFNIICHITTVSGCDREINAHFYSAASLWYQIPDTFT